MRTADEILKPHEFDVHYYGSGRMEIIEAINEARKETIEECLILIEQKHTVRGLIEAYQNLINELK